MKRRCSISPSILTFSAGAWGRELLEHLIDELEKRGILTLWLEVRASNAAAIALYESLGFNRGDDPSQLLSNGPMVMKTPSSWRCQSACKIRCNDEEVGLDFL